MAAEIKLERIAIDGRFKHLHTYYIIDADVADALRRDGHAALGRVGIDSRSLGFHFRNRHAILNDVGELLAPVGVLVNRNASARHDEFVAAEATERKHIKRGRRFGQNDCLCETRTTCKSETSYIFQALGEGQGAFESVAAFKRAGADFCHQIGYHQ